MNRSALSIMLSLVLPFGAAAADRMRDVQAELKTQGFYYGELNGESTSETVAAIRRYQIRNGLEVTGTLTKGTLDALGIGGAGAPEPAPAPAPAPKPRPQATPRSAPAENTDKEFLRREETVRPAPPAASPSYDPSVVAPPAPLDPPSADFPVLFANTPYATAPREVQESTLRRAQAALSSRGFYREVIDGLPGPATEEALLSYQRSLRLPLTGRLDLETLSNLRLLPGRPPMPVRGTVRMPSNGPRIYRGIIVR